MFILSSNGKVEDAHQRGWALWSQIRGVGEGGIWNTSGRCGLWIRETLPPLRLVREIIASDCGLLFGVGEEFLPFDGEEP